MIVFFAINDCLDYQQLGKSFESITTLSVRELSLQTKQDTRTTLYFTSKNFLFDISLKYYFNSKQYI